MFFEKAVLVLTLILFAVEYTVHLLYRFITSLRPFKPQTPPKHTLMVRFRPLYPKVSSYLKS